VRAGPYIVSFMSRRWDFAESVLKWFYDFAAQRLDHRSDRPGAALRCGLLPARRVRALDHTLEGIHLVPALVILSREILVSGLREFLARADVSLPVTRITKVKTVMQMIAIAALIACSASERMLPGVTLVALAGLWAAAALTFYTGYAYFRAGLIHARSQPIARASSSRPGQGTATSPQRRPA
jgi:hypothetical protein